MLSRDIFEHRTQACQDSVLPPDITARIVVEEASTFGWGALRRQVRPDHRDGDIRRVGATHGAATKIRVSCNENSGTGRTA